MKRLSIIVFLFCLTIVFVTACREDVALIPSEKIIVNPSVNKDVDYKGFYLLNEGNMGSNKCTMDYYDLDSGVFHRNIYAEINPTVPKELGDVGNDIQIYGSKLYAVINVSNKVEVMDAQTAKRIGKIEIPNCRYIQFHKGFAYVTSYAGPVMIDPNYKQIGFVAKVDTAKLEVVGRCLVGFQPDELAITGEKIYVANSGGYMGADTTAGYERTVSVINIETFKEQKRIDVAYNLHRIRADKRGDLWVTSRGDYKGLPSRLFFIDKETEQVTDTIPIAVSNMHLDGDSLYVYSVEWSWLTHSNEITYGIVDTKTHKVLTKKFITDGTDEKIQIPYGIMVHPITKDIYVTDAGNYVYPGYLYCFDKEGKKKWSVRAGNIPAHFVLLEREEE